jgi:hypothetical protein
MMHVQVLPRTHLDGVTPAGTGAAFSSRTFAAARDPPAAAAAESSPASLVRRCVRGLRDWWRGVRLKFTQQTHTTRLLLRCRIKQSTLTYKTAGTVQRASPRAACRRGQLAAALVAAAPAPAARPLCRVAPQRHGVEQRREVLQLAGAH